MSGAPRTVGSLVGTAANGTRNAVLGATALLPRRGLAALLRGAVGRRHLALCLHQARRDDEPPHPIADNASRESDIDELLDLLTSALSPGRVVVTFDDGYAAAAEYVRTRAPRHPSMDWLFFVCPEKTEKRIGFRWDVMAECERAGRTLPPPEPFDPVQENRRRDLAEVAEVPEYRLATVDECRALADLPNVSLGNHGNAHLPWSRLSPAQAEQDLDASLADFERLFGPCSDVAIPFGTPGTFFGDEHVRAIRERSNATIWTTEGRAYEGEHRRPSSLLPRFGVPGGWPARKTAALIALQCLVHSGHSRRGSLGSREA